MRSLARSLAQNCDDHHLVYFLDSEPTLPFSDLPNVEAKVLRPFPMMNTLLTRLGGADPWYRYRLRLSRTWNSLDAFICNAHEPVPVGAGPPRVAIVHDLAFMRADAERYFPQEVIRHLDRWTAESVHSAAKVMAVSMTTAADTMRVYGLPESKIVVLPNAHDSGVFHSSIPRPDIRETLVELNLQGPYFLHVGTAQPRKNIPAIVQAFQKLISRDQIAHSLVLLGGAGWNGPHGTMESIPETNRIIQSSSMSNQQVAHLMAGADALIMAGFYEGFGLPALEAMACGTPVIAAQAGALPEVVGDAGIYFDPNDPNELATIMDSLTKDEPLRRALGKRGLARARTFSWETTACGLLDVIKEIA